MLNNKFNLGSWSGRAGDDVFNMVLRESTIEKIMNALKNGNQDNIPTVGNHNNVF